MARTSITRRTPYRRRTMSRLTKWILSGAMIGPLAADLTFTVASAPEEHLDAIKKVRAAEPTPGSAFEGLGPEADQPSPAAIEEILGHKAQSQDGVVKVTIGRDGTMHGVKVGGSMGLTTWAAFTGGDKHAVVDGDFIMTAREVQPVLRTLRKAGFHIVALHNHMIGEEPSFFFLHFWGKGPTEQLAQGIKSALEAQAISTKEQHER